MKSHVVSRRLAGIFAFALIVFIACSSSAARGSQIAKRYNSRRALATAAAQSAPTVRIGLPERFRLLTDQRFDLRVEAAALKNPNATIRIMLDGADVTAQMPPPEFTQNSDADVTTLDCAWVFRKWGFSRSGVRTVQAIVTDGGRTATATRRIGVQAFQLAPNFKNIILFIGDSMGASHRDAARIVLGSTNNGLREGFYDRMLHMDQMPVTGMVITHALDRVTPDSANTASAWATGNKTIGGALGVLPDNNDHRFRLADPATRAFALDNPRVETIWEYLKRRHEYRTGIVTTSDVTDATPAAQAAHASTRAMSGDVARQYVDGVINPTPTFDVILGGGRHQFTERTMEANGDARNLIDELRAAGWSYVETRGELRQLSNIAESKTGKTPVQKEQSRNGSSYTKTANQGTGQSRPAGGKTRAVPDKLLGLFSQSTMAAAYDKLNLERPSDETKTNVNGGDQPFLNEMTAAALAVLSKDDRPFMLLVEGALIDRESHANNAAGSIWETIDFDRAVGVGRSFLTRNAETQARTLMLVTADHDQSMTVIGVTDTSTPGATANVRSSATYPTHPNGTKAEGINKGETEGFPDYQDANNDGYPENGNRLRLAVGFRTSNHTANSVPLTAEGAGALLFTGYYDQTDIFFKIARVLSSDTLGLDKMLDEKSNLQIIKPDY